MGRRRRGGWKGGQRGREREGKVGGWSGREGGREKEVGARGVIDGGG